LQYPNGFFEVKFIGQSFIIVDRAHLKEVMDGPEPYFSHRKVSEEILQLEYTFHPDMTKDLYHIPVVRGQLTRSIPNMMEDIVDELDTAINDEIGILEGILERTC
jgi:hypothetical protein